MKVVYNAPNRSHHYPLARAFQKKGLLKFFVSGYPRGGERDQDHALRDKIIRADHLQYFYHVAIRLRLFCFILQRIATWAKCWIDIRTLSCAKECDLVLAYNGAAKRTFGQLRKKDKCPLLVVESVNTHVLYQKKILQREYRKLGLPFNLYDQLDIERRVAEYQLSDYILCPSEFVRNSFISEGVNAEKCVVIPYGIELSENKILNSWEQKDGLIVLYVGSIQPRKGLHYLVRAFNSIDADKKELWLVGASNHFTGLEKESMGSDIKFLGVKRGAELWKLYAQATLKVLPTLEDGFGLVIVEALSVGLPVVASTSSAAQDIFDDGECGFHYPFNDVNSLKKSILKIYEDSDLRRRQSINGINQIKKVGGWEQTMDTFRQAFENKLK